MKKPRGVFIAGNWKMNHGPQATERFFKDLAQATPSVSSLLKTKGLTTALFVPAVSLQAAKSAAASAQLAAIRIGAQNAHWEPSGAFTGELSAPLLSEIGVKNVLVGHSERRQFFGETDSSCRKRTEGLLKQGIEVMLCVGETRQEREAGETQSVLKRQLAAVLGEKPGASEFTARAYMDGRLTIAYEPVWAIGTGLTATPEQAQEAHAFIRGFLKTSVGAAESDRTPLLYGGSVTPQNVEALLSSADIDGALVGGASLKSESFLALVTVGAQQCSA